MSETTALELVLAFQPIAPDAPDDAPVGFSVRCPGVGASWDGGQFVNPLDDAKVTGEIRWYLEEYWKWPTNIDLDRAHNVEASLNAWGRDLFNAVFDRREPARIYEAFLNHEAAQRRVIIEAQAPRVQRLPWELLAESSGPLFSRRTPISISRRVALEHAPAIRTFALPLRVLLTVSRPEEAGFIDPRSSARGMLDALAPLLAAGQVVVDFLRPPTLKALDDVLRRAERAGRPYHIVHFDGHGVYHRQTGLGQLAFERDDASLDLVDANRLGALLQECGVPLMILEACQSAQGDQSNPFSSVAARMIEAGIGGVLSMSHSVLVVTAGMFVQAFYRALTEGCTVGQATDEARRALVQDTRRLSLERMGRAGYLDLHDWFLPVLYQQTADAAPFAAPFAASEDLTGFPKPVRSTGDPFAPLEAAMGCLLDQLTQDHPLYMDALGFQHRLDENLRFARADGDTEIRRSDRAAILRGLDALALQALGLPFEMLAEEGDQKSESGDRKSESGDQAAPTPYSLLPTPPLHGFVGRARELLAMERRFRDHGIVVLHGWGGVGKTALSAEAARWLTRTGFVRSAVFVSFEHCQSAEYALAEVGRALVEENFNVGAGDPVARVSAALQKGDGAQGAGSAVLFPALIIFDNFESALGANALLSGDDLRRVLDAAKAWAKAGARVLITTRDITFGDAALGPGKLTAHHALTGLSAPDALALAAEILENHGIDRAAIEREGLQRLLTALHGHPLSLELVLPHLRDRTPAQLCDEFGALLAEFRSGKGEQRNESLLVSLDFSLRRLDATTRAALPDLAVFEGGVLEPLICGSHGFPQITGMDEAAWRAARAALESAALLTAEPLPGVSVPYIHFHPTLLPYLREAAPTPAPPPTGEGIIPPPSGGAGGGILTRYQQAYVALSRYLYRSDRQNPIQARAIARREMPNLRRALDLTLQAGDFETAASLANAICTFLDNFGRAREREQVMERVSGSADQRISGSADRRGGGDYEWGVFDAVAAGGGAVAGGAGGGGGGGVPRVAGAAGRGRGV